MSGRGAPAPNCCGTYGPLADSRPETRPVASPPDYRVGLRPHPAVRCEEALGYRRLCPVRRPSQVHQGPYAAFHGIKSVSGGIPHKPAVPSESRTAVHRRGCCSQCYARGVQNLVGGNQGFVIPCGGCLPPGFRESESAGGGLEGLLHCPEFFLGAGHLGVGGQVVHLARRLSCILHSVVGRHNQAVIPRWFDAFCASDAPSALHPFWCCH